MLLSLLPVPLLLASAATAQRIAEHLSFGHKFPITPNTDGNIPGWQASSSNHNLQVLSDRVIMTPPGPGKTRGALWSEFPADSETWSAEVDFRASGSDTGAGSSLNFWFARDKTGIFIDSVYTASNFDGLVVVVDQYGNTGGKIRGFLNDGSVDFKNHDNLESLAFGHCDYAYRNLGRKSSLRVSSENGLTIYIDERECFRSDNIALPSGYYYGITAASGEQPDSFEVHKFIVNTAIPHTHEHIVKGGSPPIQQQQKPIQQRRDSPPQLQKLDRFPGAPEAVPDKLASEIKSQEDQFADLHNRLQTLTHQVAAIFLELETLGLTLEERHIQVLGSIPTTIGTTSGGSGVASPNLEAKLDGINRRVENIERIAEYTRKGYENVERIVEYTRKGHENIEKIVEYTRKEMEGKQYHEHFDKLHVALDSVTQSTPRMGFFLFVVVGVQVALAGSYVVYKRRRGQMPKKYL